MMPSHVLFGADDGSYPLSKGLRFDERRCAIRAAGRRLEGNPARPENDHTEATMRIINIKTAEETEHGSRHVIVEWQDGSSTTESVPGTVPQHQYAAWLETKRGRKLKCWR